MAVKFASAVSCNEYDGIDWLQDRLAKSLGVQGQAVLVVGLVTTKSVNTDRTLNHVPTVEFAAIEAVPADSALGGEGKALLEKLFRTRLGGVHEETVELPGFDVVLEAEGVARSAAGFSESEDPGSAELDSGEPEATDPGSGV